MNRLARLSLFGLHVMGVFLCLVSTLVMVDQSIPLVPRYTALGGWLDHLDAEPVGLLWLTTWSVILASLPAIGLYGCEDPGRRRPRPPRRVRTDRSRLPVAGVEPPDELVISWVGPGKSVTEMNL